jgi:hypothetical protein
LADTRDTATSWRARAQELRVEAANMIFPSSQEKMRKLAAEYEQLADRLDAAAAEKKAAA